MPCEDNSQQEQSLTTIAYRFLIGVAFGGLVLPLVYFYAMFLMFYPIEWNATMIEMFALAPIVCGALSAVFGKRFLDGLLNVVVGLLRSPP